MLVCYCNPIKIVYENYNNNYSISEIITNDNIKYNIFFWSVLMGIFTILYEFYRNYISLIIILFLLLEYLSNFTKENKPFFVIITFLHVLLFKYKYIYDISCMKIIVYYFYYLYCKFYLYY